MNLDEINDDNVLIGTSTYDQETFKDLLNHLDNKYYNDMPIISDDNYDILVKLYEKKFGKYKNIEPTFKLSGLNKITKEKHLLSWIDKYKGEYLVEDKIDGVTLLIVYSK